MKKSTALLSIVLCGLITGPAVGMKRGGKKSYWSKRGRGARHNTPSPRGSRLPEYLRATDRSRSMSNLHNHQSPQSPRGPQSPVSTPSSVSSPSSVNSFQKPPFKLEKIFTCDRSDGDRTNIWRETNCWLLSAENRMMSTEVLNNCLMDSRAKRYEITRLDLSGCTNIILPKVCWDLLDDLQEIHLRNVIFGDADRDMLFTLLARFEGKLQIYVTSETFQSHLNEYKETVKACCNPPVVSVVVNGSELIVVDKGLTTQNLSARLAQFDEDIRKCIRRVNLCNCRNIDLKKVSWNLLPNVEVLDLLCFYPRKKITSCNDIFLQKFTIEDLEEIKEDYNFVQESCGVFVHFLFWNKQIDAYMVENDIRYSNHGRYILDYVLDGVYGSGFKVCFLLLAKLSKFEIGENRSLFSDGYFDEKQ